MGSAHDGNWDIGSIAFYFSIAAGIYLQARLVSPRIPEKGEIDLKQFHREEGRKYLIAYTILGVVTVITNAALGGTADASQWPAQNLVIVPMTLATGLAAIFIKRPWVQGLALRDPDRRLDLVLCRASDGAGGVSSTARSVRVC